MKGLLPDRENRMLVGIVRSACERDVASVGKDEDETMRRSMTWTVRATLAALLCLTACGGEQKPPPPPPPNLTTSATVAPPPSATTPPPPAPTTSASAAQAEPPPGKYTTEVVIHQAEIHGKIKLKAGKKLVVEPLVATSATSPQKGNKASVFRSVGKKGTDADWLLIGEGEVAETWTAGSGKNVEVNVLDEKKDALIDGKPAFHFAPGTMVRVRWEW